jgi:hypothetical protein
MSVVGYALLFLVTASTANQQREHFQSPSDLSNLQGERLPTFAALPSPAIGSEQIPAGRLSSNKLTDKDTILLADFAYNTDDEIFNGTLEQALRVALEESPFLSLLPEASVVAKLNDMARPANTPLSPDIARMLRQSTDSKAYVTGSVSSPAPIGCCSTPMFISGTLATILPEPPTAFAAPHTHRPRTLPRAISCIPHLRKKLSQRTREPS